MSGLAVVTSDSHFRWRTHHYHDLRVHVAPYKLLRGLLSINKRLVRMTSLHVSHPAE